jgi:hypothetical protein
VAPLSLGVATLLLTSPSNMMKSRHVFTLRHPRHIGISPVIGRLAPVQAESISGPTSAGLFCRYSPGKGVLPRWVVLSA